jgi:drug/metabolite transporter (DMT)-like permease
MSTKDLLQLALDFLFSTSTLVLLFSERMTFQGVLGMVIVSAGVLLTFLKRAIGGAHLSRNTRPQMGRLN